jgi:hypothetical protein
MADVSDKQTGNKRVDGKFAEGNKIGNRFQPGESGNPKGRPKSITLSEAYRRQLAQPVPKDSQGRTYAEVIAELMCKRATQGDVAAAREVADRVEGKARQALDVDMKVTDWREMARTHGLNVQDVIDQARLIIESEPVADSSSG